jgi:hypothetical protein
MSPWFFNRAKSSTLMETSAPTAFGLVEEGIIINIPFMKGQY